jgi:hypothetical protein
MIFGSTNLKLQRLAVAGEFDAGFAAVGRERFQAECSTTVSDDGGGIGGLTFQCKLAALSFLCCGSVFGAATISHSQITVLSSREQPMLQVFLYDDHSKFLLCLRTP